MRSTARLLVALAIAGCAGQPQVGPRTKAAPRESARAAQRPPPGRSQDTRWAAAPDDCDLEAPALNDITPLRFESCGSAPFPCLRADADWAASSGWGFGGLLSSRESDDGEVELSFSRAIAPRVWESVVQRGDEVIFALRARVPESRCMIGGPHLSPEGAAVVVRRAAMMAEPWVFTGATPERVLASPRVLPFTVTSEDVATLGPSSVALHRSNGLVLRNLEDERWISHPLNRPVWAADGTLWAEGSRTHFGTLYQVDGAHAGALPPPPGGRLRLRLTAGGPFVAWIEATPTEDLARFEDRTLVVLRAGSSDEVRRIAIGPGTASPMVVGEHNTVLRLSDQELLVVDLESGRQSTLEAPTELAWAGGRSPIALAGGVLWARAAHAGRAANDGRALFRFELTP
ncbi:MAG: hypothetical protein AAGE52_03825 [Myxococcota bacterium]